MLSAHPAPFSARFALVALATGVVPAMAAAPDNDAFADATWIDALPFSDSLDTTEATTEATDPSCVGNGPTVWYAWTAPWDVDVAVSTAGSDYDTTASVWTGSPGAFSEVACNDDSDGTLQSRASWSAVEGETYWVMIGAYANGVGGSLVVTLDEYVPFELSGTVDTASTVIRTGDGKVEGTIVCSGDGWFSVSGQLTQRTGRFETVGWFSAGGLCGPEGTSWVAPLDADGALAGLVSYTAYFMGGSFASGDWGSDDAMGSLRARGWSGR